MTEEIKELGKKKIGYERQVAIFGQKAADNVLSFWLLGYNEAESSTKELREEINKWKELHSDLVELDKFSNSMIKSRDEEITQLKEVNERIIKKNADLVIQNANLKEKLEVAVDCFKTIMLIRDNNNGYVELQMYNTAKHGLTKINT